jgi:hypothetical protein
MGAAPGWHGQQVAASPRREFEDRSVCISSQASKPGPRRYFARVPTYAVGVASERRRYPRASLSLPLRLTRVGETAEAIPVVLVTRDISSTGIFFLAPREIAIGTAVELQVALVERPLGCGSVQMITAAHVVRSEKCDMPGWHGYAAGFDDFAIERDDGVPTRFQTT